MLTTKRSQRLAALFMLSCLGILPLEVLCASTSGAPKNNAVPKFKKVVLVLFENENIDRPLSQPFFTKLAHEGALLKNYHAVAHPSVPNYIALTSGDTQGVTGDSDYDLNVKHLGDLLEEKSKSWRNYAEDYPESSTGSCFRGGRSGKYVRKHTPFMSYTNVSKTARCKNIVDASHFYQDVKNGTLPDFSFFTPNLDNDVHDTDITFGERWFKTTFEPLLALPNFKDVLLIVTFDENECNTIGPFVTPAKHAKCKGDLNQVYTVFYGAEVRAGAVSLTHYDHYSLLTTLELGFDLTSLGKKDQSAKTITDIWK